MLSVSKDHKLVGIDGCSGGWVAMWRDADGTVDAHVYANIRELYKAHKDAGILAIDIPIGLPHADATDRACDAEARKRLGGRLASRVFTPPTREALAAPDYEGACDENEGLVGRRLSRQSWNIGEKIREVDALLQSDATAREKLVEAHPELAFLRLNGGKPVFPPKHSVAGKAMRLKLLADVFSEFEAFLDRLLSLHTRRALGADDVIDAAGLLAMLIQHGERLEVLPSDPAPTDAKGIPQRMIC